MALRARILPRLPATLTGAAGITITKINGIWTVGLASNLDALIAIMTGGGADELTGIGGLNALGFVARTADGAYAARTVTGSNGVGVTNPQGIAGDLLLFGTRAFTTIAVAQAATIPADIKRVVIDEYAALMGGQGGRYKRVTVSPVHGGRFRSTDRFLPNGTTDATNGGWWEVEDKLSPEMFGSDTTNYLVAFQTAVAASESTGLPICLTEGKDYPISAVLNSGGATILGAGGYAKGSTIRAVTPGYIDPNLISMGSHGRVIGVTLDGANLPIPTASWLGVGLPIGGAIAAVGTSGTHLDHPIIRDCLVKNTPSGGVFLKLVDDSVVEGNRFENVQTYTGNITSSAIETGTGDSALTNFGGWFYNNIISGYRWKGVSLGNQRTARILGNICRSFLGPTPELSASFHESGCFGNVWDNILDASCFGQKIINSEGTSCRLVAKDGNYGLMNVDGSTYVDAELIVRNTVNPSLLRYWAALTSQSGYDLRKCKLNVRGKTDSLSGSFIDIGVGIFPHATQVIEDIEISAVIDGADVGVNVEDGPGRIVRRLKIHDSEFYNCATNIALRGTDCEIDNVQVSPTGTGTCIYATSMDSIVGGTLKITGVKGAVNASANIVEVGTASAGAICTFDRVEVADMSTTGGNGAVIADLSRNGSDVSEIIISRNKVLNAAQPSALLVTLSSHTSTSVTMQGNSLPISPTVATMNGNVTSGNAIVPGIASTTGLLTGMIVTGTGIAANTAIQTVDSAVQVTLTIPPTAGAGTPVSLTFTSVGGGRRALKVAQPVYAYSGNVTSGSQVVPGFSTTGDMEAGMTVTGTGIPTTAIVNGVSVATPTTILSVDSATQITLSVNATAGAGTPVSLTFTGESTKCVGGIVDRSNDCGIVALPAACDYVSKVRLTNGTLDTTLGGISGLNHEIYSPDGERRMVFGSGADPTIYYQADTHRRYNKAFTVEFSRESTAGFELLRAWAHPIAVVATTYVYAAITTDLRTIVTGISNTGGLLEGMGVSGAGIPGATTIASVGDGQVTLSAVATATGTPTLTFTGSAGGSRTLDASYSTVLVDASDGSRTTVLPSATGVKGREYTVIKTDASANTVTVQDSGGANIDAAATRVLTTRFESVTPQSNGAQWYTRGTIATVVDGTITTAKLADLAVTTAKIAALNVTTAKIAAEARPTVTLVTATGAYTPPAGATWLDIELGGGGGGGGGGARQPSATACSGGGGGGSGNITRGRIRVADATFPVTITIAAGGTAGTAATSDGTAGGNGGAGGSSTFGSYFIAFGGGGGSGGAAATNSAGGGGSGSYTPGGTASGATAGTAGNVGGGAGGSAANGTSSSVAGAGGGGTNGTTGVATLGGFGTAVSGGTGGGPGGGIPVGATFNAGGRGGANSVAIGGANGGLAGGATDGAAGATASAAIFIGGLGGGGGASSVLTVGGAGGIGQVSSGGGGGGGSALNGSNGGIGGVGAAGRCRITAS